MQNTGCCGADCNACAARKATARGDSAALAKLAADQEGAGHSFVLPSRLRCTGCTARGAKSISCAECAIRACALASHIPHCGFCPEFPCDLGSAVWEAVPEYKHNIEVLRSR